MTFPIANCRPQLILPDMDLSLVCHGPTRIRMSSVVLHGEYGEDYSFANDWQFEHKRLGQPRRPEGSDTAPMTLQRPHERDPTVVTCLCGGELRETCNTKGPGQGGGLLQHGTRFLIHERHRSLRPCIKTPREHQCFRSSHARELGELRVIKTSQESRPPGGIPRREFCTAVRCVPMPALVGAIALFRRAQ
jgi:hypothetical protein